MDLLWEMLFAHLKDIVTIALDYFINWYKTTVYVKSIKDFVYFGEEVFDTLLEATTNVLTATPAEWNVAGWSFVVNTINTVFIAFGCQLVVLFFLMGFISESIDPRADIRIETIIKGLFKILLAEFLVCNSVNIVTGFFGFIGDLTSFFSPEVLNTGHVWLEDRYLLDMGIGPSIITVFMSFLYMLVLSVSGVMLIYTAYMRFFKILVIIPFGTIASATVAGNHTLRHTAVQFYKYILGLVFEGITIIIATSLYSIIKPGFKLLSVGGEWYYSCELFNGIILTLLLVGIVKGAGNLTNRVLGL